MKPQEGLHFGMTEQPLQDCRDVWIGKRSMKSNVDLCWLNRARQRISQGIVLIAKSRTKTDRSPRQHRSNSSKQPGDNRGHGNNSCNLSLKLLPNLFQRRTGTVARDVIKWIETSPAAKDTLTPEHVMGSTYRMSSTIE